MVNRLLPKLPGTLVDDAFEPVAFEFPERPASQPPSAQPSQPKRKVRIPVDARYTIDDTGQTIIDPRYPYRYVEVDEGAPRPDLSPKRAQPDLDPTTAPVGWAMSKLPEGAQKALALPGLIAALPEMAFEASRAKQAELAPDTLGKPIEEVDAASVPATMLAKTASHLYTLPWAMAEGVGHAVQSGFQTQRDYLAGAPVNQKSLNQAAFDLASMAPLGVGAAKATSSIVGQAADTGDLGVFAGRSAARNLESAGRPGARLALDLADELERSGFTPDEIAASATAALQQSDPALGGVSKGVDGKWRFEIDDSQSRFAPGYDLARGRHEQLPDMFDHPDYFTAYPDMREGYGNATLAKELGGEFSYDAVNPQTNKSVPLIEAQAPTAEDARSVILHELQHGAQVAEKFASGASPDMFKQGPEIRRAYTAPMVEDIAEYNYSTPFARLPKFTQQRVLDVATDALYRNSAGEVEARNVQSRMDMTPEQRRAVAPSATQDRPAGQQVIIDPEMLARDFPDDPASARIFAGRNAATADAEALARAEELERSGAPREEVWNETGWFRGVDGQWRFEIDDSNVSLAMFKRSGILPEVMKHPDFYNAYPRLRETRVMPMGGAEGSAYAGGFTPGQNRLFGLWKSPGRISHSVLTEALGGQDALKSTMLPEMQQIGNQALDLSRKLMAAEEGVPSAPFISNTSDWVDLGLKQTLIDAARDPSVNRLAWTPGDVQAQRYGMESQVGALRYNPDTGVMTYLPRDAAERVMANPARLEGHRWTTLPDTYTPDQLPGVVGKELADKLLAAPKVHESNYGQGADYHQLLGLDLKVGGEGHKKFYGTMSPEGYQSGIVGTRLSKLVKGLDPEAARIEGSRPGVSLEQQGGEWVARSGGQEARSPLRQEALDVIGVPEYPSIPITPALRKKILEEGLSLFANKDDLAAIGAIVAAAERESANPTVRAAQRRASDVPFEDKLAVQHNMRGTSFAHNMRSYDGNIPVPSLAISKAGQPLTNFGDISLFGDPSMAIPKGSNPIYPADAYTKRSPKIVRDVPKSADRDRMVEELTGQKGKGYGLNLDDPYWDTNFRVGYLRSKGLTPPDGVDLDFWARNAIGYGERDAMEAFVNDFLDSHRGLIRERINHGWSNDGERRLYKPHNLDNMVKASKGKAGSEDFDYGPNAWRAHTMSPFRSMAEIQENRGLINRVSKEDMDALKDELANKGFRLTEAMGYRDTYADMVLDGLRHPDPEVRNLAKELRDDLAGLPTEYFEAKPQRAVGLDEFKLAAVPESMPDVARSLDRMGLDVRSYDRSKMGEDGAPITEILRSRPDLLFSNNDQLSLPGIVMAGAEERKPNRLLNMRPFYGEDVGPKGRISPETMERYADVRSGLPGAPTDQGRFNQNIGALLQEGVADKQTWAYYRKQILSRGGKLARDMKAADQNWKPTDVISKEELARFLDERAPQIKVERYGGEDLGDEPYHAIDRETVEEDGAYLEKITYESDGGNQYEVLIDEDAGNVYVTGPDGESIAVDAPMNKMREQHATAAIDADIRRREGGGYDNTAKWQDYAIKGGDDYREVAIGYPKELRERDSSTVGGFRDTSHMPHQNLEGWYRGQDFGNTMHLDEVQPQRYEKLRDAGEKQSPERVYALNRQHEAILQAADSDTMRAQSALGSVRELIDGNRFILSSFDARGLADLQQRLEGAAIRVQSKVEADPIGVDAPRLRDVVSDLRENARIIGSHREKMAHIEGQLQAATEGVEPSPYTGSINDATDHLVKQALIDASRQKGRPARLSWSDGDTVADLMGIQQQISRVDVVANPDGVGGDNFTRSARIHDPHGRLIGRLDVDDNGIVVGGADFDIAYGKRLEEVVGKDMARKIMEADVSKADSSWPPVAEISGDDLKIGGEGMRGYYGTIDGSSSGGRMASPGILGERIQSQLEKVGQGNARPSVNPLAQDARVVSVPGGYRIRAQDKAGTYLDDGPVAVHDDAVANLDRMKSSLSVGLDPATLDKIRDIGLSLYANSDEIAIVSAAMAMAEGGEPIRAYHGTNSVFDRFDRIDGGNARGDAIYFSTDPASASAYAMGDTNRITPKGNAGPNVLPVDITAKLYEENAMIDPEVRRQIAEVHNQQLREELGRELYPDELMDPDEFASTWFDRAYEPKGYNVLQSLSYDPNEQNALLRAMGYDGRRGGAFGRGGAASGQDIALWNRGTVKSATTGETLFSNDEKLAVGALGNFVTPQEAIDDARVFADDEFGRLYRPDQFGVVRGNPWMLDPSDVAGIEATKHYINHTKADFPDNFYMTNPVNEAGDAPLSGYDVGALGQQWRDKVRRTGELFSNPAEMSFPAFAEAMAQAIDGDGYGERPDGTRKGPGFLGELQRPDGAVSTELSIGVPIGGRETEIPLLVPTLSQQEIDWLLSQEDLDPQSVPQSIVDKAIEHAVQRLEQGLSPFEE